MWSLDLWRGSSMVEWRTFCCCCIKDYINRLSNKSVRFERFKVYIQGIMKIEEKIASKNNKKIEEKIASKNNKLPQHFQKWDLLGGRF